MTSTTSFDVDDYAHPIDMGIYASNLWWSSGLEFYHTYVDAIRNRLYARTDDRLFNSFRACANALTAFGIYHMGEWNRVL